MIIDSCSCITLNVKIQQLIYIYYYKDIGLVDKIKMLRGNEYSIRNIVKIFNDESYKSYKGGNITNNIV
jgi:hypothetical protein